MGALQSSPPRSYAAAPHERCAGPPKPRLLDRVREAIRTRHYSRRSILFHGKRHPTEMGAAEAARFLTSLAVSATRSPPTCSRTATTPARSRRCWATAT